MGEFNQCSDKKEYENYEHQKKIERILDKMDRRRISAHLSQYQQEAGKQRLLQIFA